MESDWRESQNLGFDFMSGLNCYEVENALDRPSMTTDCGANVSAGVELKNLWDWNKCACHMLHLGVNAGLNATTIDVRLQPLYKLCALFESLLCGMEEIQKEASKRLWVVCIPSLKVKGRVNVKEMQMRQIEVL